MDSLDLMEIRKKLHSYKKTGKKNVMSILKQLHEATITISQLNESKINKTIRTLAKLQIKDLVDSDYLEQDLIQLKQKASELYVKFSQMSENDQFRKQSLVSEAKSNVSEQQQSQQPQQQQQSQQSSQSQGMDSQEDLIKKLELPHDYSAIRVKVIQTLLSRVLNGKYDNPKLNKVADFEIAKFVKKLEFEINLRHNEKHYQSAIKEVLKYISMDKDGSVRNRLLSGIIDAPTAALLKSEDWTSEQKLKEATQIGRESIKANDLMHNKKLAQDINKDTPLGLCNNCNQKSLKMVNEIQTRASDEPSTKFWECINCGISETTNG